MRDWHRIFGVSLADVVTGLPFHVVLELELSRPKQRLDVAVIRLAERSPAEHSWPDLPDGLTDLADHNLVSYKSIRESLTCGAMWELVSHLVIYGKQQWAADWEAAVIVPREVARTPRNAVWHLLSGDQELVRYGMEHYRPRDATLYNALNDLKEIYALEGVEMPYTIEDYRREVAHELFAKMSPRERLELLSDLSPGEIQAYLKELRKKQPQRKKPRAKR